MTIKDWLKTIKYSTIKINLLEASSCPVQVLFPVKGIHGVVQACHGEGDYGFARFFQSFGQLCPFFFIPETQYVLDLRPFRIVIPNAKSQSGVILGLQHLIDIGQAIVPTRAPFALDPYGSKGEIKIIGHHQQILKRDLFEVQPIVHGLSAQIHKSVWLQKDKGSSLVSETTQVAELFGFKADIFVTGKTVKNGKAYIVPGIVILFTDIAQSDDQKFFHVSLNFALPQKERPDFHEQVHAINIKKSFSTGEKLFYSIR